MNQVLPPKYDERVTRLALGIELLDALRQGRIPHPIQITYDQVSLGLQRPRVWRHNSCVFVLLFEKGVGGSVDLRFFDAAEPAWDADLDRRRYVPRRLRIPLLSRDQADLRPYTQRVRRPALFPGAAYNVSESSTGMRGRVERNGKPLRWARVEAIQPDSGQTVGRAHCDDRGEFLLLLEPQAAAQGNLATNFVLNLRAYAPQPPGPEVTDAMKKLDPLWDLPVEEAPGPGAADPVCAGDLPWNKWAPGGIAQAPFTLGRLSRQNPAIII
jgi:hypothetical protein